MLSLDSFNLECNFWLLPVTKDFEHQPEHYIGETLFHIIQVPQGQILHPVQIIGLEWTGNSWGYNVLLPPDHPEFKEENNEIIFLESRQLETM